MPHRIDMLVLLAVAGLCSAPANSQCIYDVGTGLGPDCGFPFGPTFTEGRGINSFGEAVGMYRQCAHSSRCVAVRWTPETGLEELTGFPPDTFTSEAYDINDGGQIIGVYAQPDPEFGLIGFLIDGESFTSLGTLPNGTISTPAAINEAGDIVGHAGNNVKGPIEAFLWHDGLMQTLNGMPPANDSRASDINDKGQIVGRYIPTTEGGGVVRHAFLWDSGTFTDIGVIPGGISGEATAINNHGHVVGFGRINLPEEGFIVRPFLWIDGEMTLIDLPDEFTVCGAIDINDAGVILLGCEMLWQDGVLSSLDDLVPKGIEIKNVSEITNNGILVGRAHVEIPGEPGETASALAVFTPQAPLTDLTGDCRTDAADLRILLGQWGDTGGNSTPADFNNDGVVGPRDLAILLGNWG